MSGLPEIQSDNLADLRPLFSARQLAAQFRPPLQLNLIVDANVIQADLRWLCKKRKKPEARTSFGEALAAETVVAFAPTYLIEEVHEHIPNIAEAAEVSPPVVYAEWQRYRRQIAFVDTGGPDDTFLDPDDAPYAKLQELIGIQILSDDAHFQRMGYSAIGKQVLVLLRDYSRSAAVEYSFKSGGVTAVCLAAGVLAELTTSIMALIAGYRRLPRAVQAFGAIGLAITMMHAPSRQWLSASCRTLGSWGVSIGPELLSHVTTLVQEHQTAKDAADSLRDQIYRAMTPILPLGLVGPASDAHKQRQAKPRRRHEPLAMVGFGASATTPPQENKQGRKPNIHPPHTRGF